MKNAYWDMPERICNVDEKSLSTSHKPPNVVSSSCLKPPAASNSCRQTITVLGCGSAQAQQVPPPLFYIPWQKV